MASARRWIRILSALAVVFTVVLALALVAGAVLYRLSRTLPDLGSASTSLRAARTSIVYAGDGSVLTEWHGEQDRKVVPLDRIRKSARDAVIVAEDQSFYTHGGVDTDAVFRALNGEAGRGTSTITLQLVRMLFADKQSGLTSKLRQALMAWQIEARTSKDRVLEAYLNMVYLGNGRYGMESAARGYFGKSASDLTLAESALLAGVISSPTRYSPAVDPIAAKKRRDEILSRMRDLDYITSEQEVAARSEKIEIAPTLRSETSKVAPHFVEYVKRQLIEKLGADAVFTGGLRVHTTLDPTLQRAAEAAVHDVLPDAADPEAALVAIDPRDGRVLAMVGGRDYATAQYNLAVQGRRQPGSAFKPFVLVAALNKGVSPDRKFDAAPYSVRVKNELWRVENYENAYTSGQLTLRAATDWSVNAVFARLIMEIGPVSVVDTARRMGITSPVEANPAIALGGLSKGVSPLEMASAYGTLATGGMHVDPVSVSEVTDDEGRILLEADTKPVRAIPQNVAAQASGMLHEVVEQGTGTNARISRWAAGKTGTTQSYRDAWFVGYTGEIAAAVWVGYRAGQVEMLNVHGIKVTGGSYPATIWARFANTAVTPAPPSAYDGVLVDPPSSAEVTSTLVHARICADTFMFANPRCPNVYEVDLEPSLVPAETCNRH